MPRGAGSRERTAREGRVVAGSRPPHDGYSKPPSVMVHSAVPIRALRAAAAAAV